MDYSKYASNWKDVIRPTILKRDGYRCRHCGVQHRVQVYKDSRGNYVLTDEFIREWCKKHGKRVFTLYLRVVHLDNNKMNNNPDNLLTLCSKCHSRYDADHKKIMKRVYSQVANVKYGKVNHIPRGLDLLEYNKIKAVVREFHAIELAVECYINLISIFNKNKEDESK